MFRRLKKKLFGETMSPRLPAGVRIYAVGDIHGRLDLLDALLHRIEADNSSLPRADIGYVFLGDYIDRGQMSGQVLSRLIDHSHSHSTICLKGNHETYLMQFLDDPDSLADWARVGALPTLTSYGLSPSLKPTPEERIQLSTCLNVAMPDIHKTFLLNLPTSFTLGDYFFVHAGIRPRIPLAEQQEMDLLHIREDFLFHRGTFEKFIVHGHTPVKEPEKHSNRFNIDTGAYATGRLTCLCLEADDMRLI